MRYGCQFRAILLLALFVITLVMTVAMMLIMMPTVRSIQVLRALMVCFCCCIAVESRKCVISSLTTPTIETFIVVSAITAVIKN